MIEITKPGNGKRTEHKAKCAGCECEFTFENGDCKGSILETIGYFLARLDCPECGNGCYAKVILK